jgi:predicted PurR-regulated permease PerM
MQVVSYENTHAMNYSTQILEQRNARNNRALALLITVLVHAVVLGALFYSSLADEQQTKQDVATLVDGRGEKP